MKKLFLMALGALTILSCQKESDIDITDGESVAIVSVNINGSMPGSRAVEDGHAGTNGDKVTPKVLNVTVIAYNEYGNEISRKDLDLDQIKQSAWGLGVDIQGDPIQLNKPVGATVGLPSGTKKVDVVINSPQGVNQNNYTNINYFNYRADQADKGDNTVGSKDNFDRVYLTTEYYGIGKMLENATVGDDNVPRYSLDFSVSPSLARLEVYGAIDAAEAEVWTDAYGCKWKTMTVADFEAKYIAYINANDLKADSDGNYTITKTIGTVTYTNVTFRNAVKGTASNGFDVNFVYFPERYWYDLLGKSTDRTDGTIRTEDQVDNSGGTIGASWVVNEDFAGAGTSVEWYPNMFYAIDVESIFVNNIKVRSSMNDPYLHPWPESQASTGWLAWYKAYHLDGWHTAGSSVGNTFLCMGNMWDRIATTANPEQDEKKIDFPSVNTPGNQDQMGIIVTKAIPLAGKSEYYNANRNLGVKKNMAAAYQIYAQLIASANPTKDDVMASLPHIILKVKAYENAAKYVAGDYVKAKEFITIKAFKDGNEYVSKFNKSCIYRIKLNDLLGAFVGKAPVPGGKPAVNPMDPIDPDPEMPGSQMSMTVQVMPWTILNITPDI